MFSNLQIRPAKPHRRKPSMAAKAGVAKRRTSNVSPASASNVPSMSFMQGLFGDEFPDAFATSRGRAVKSLKGIADLPSELLEIICEPLSNLDIKRLRLASRHLAAKIDLRIKRVYISPNYANLDCLQKVLSHARYRNRVREIVWDDAQLEKYSTLEDYRHAIAIDEVKALSDIEKRLEDAIRDCEDDSPEYRALESDDFFSPDGQLTEVAKGILLRYDDQFSRDNIARNALMSVDQSYALYQRLYQEEQEIMSRKSDVAALHKALAGFPNVKKLTLTSEVWRPWNLYPHYDTPFFRSLPLGFRKPTVWPWLGVGPNFTPAQVAHRDKVMSARQLDRLAVEFRGYNIIIATLLSMPNPKIEEFIIDAGNEYTGISYQLFAFHSSSYKETVLAFSRLPLQRLQLVLNSHGCDRSPDSLFASGLLKPALAQLRFLEHFDLNPNWCSPRRTPSRLFETPFDANAIFPDDLLSRLKVFALRNVFIQPDFEDVLHKMENVQHVTLDNVCSGVCRFDTAVSWFGLLHRLKEYYAASPMVSHPSFEWIQPFTGSECNAAESYLIDAEIDAFLYQGEECPFEETFSMRRVREGSGWVVDDRDRSVRARARGVWWHHQGGIWRLVE